MSTKESCRHYVETARETLCTFIRQHHGWRCGFLGALECQYCSLGFLTPDTKLWGLIFDKRFHYCLVWTILSLFLLLIPGMGVFTYHCTYHSHIIAHWECVTCIDFTKSLKGDFDILSSVRLWIIFTFNWIHFNHEMTMILWCPRVGSVFNVKYPL